MCLLPLVATLLAAATPAIHPLTSFGQPLAAKVVGENVNPASTAQWEAGAGHPSGGAIRLDYIFVAQVTGLQYVGWTGPLALPDQLGRFLAWVEGDGQDQPVRLRLVDHSGETHQFTLGRTSFHGWKQLQAKVGVGGDHWGGDGNGRLDPPLTFGCLLVDAATKPVRSTVRFGELAYTDAVPDDTPVRTAPQTMEVVAAACEAEPPHVGGDAVDPASQARLDTATPHAGRGAWRLDYTFTQREGLQYLELPLDAGLEPPAESIKLWLKGDGSRNVARLRLVDASGEYHQYNVGVVDFTDWRPFTVPLAHDDGHWGGDGNGLADGRLRLTSFLLDAVQRPSRGSIWLDDVTVRARLRPADALSVRLRPVRPGEVLDATALLEWSLTLTDRRVAAPPAGASLTVTVKDPGGAVLQRQAQVVSSGTTVTGRLAAAGAQRFGLYRVQADWEVQGDHGRSATAFARLPQLPATDLDTNLFGACFHFAQGKGQLPLTYQLFARMGGHWVRDEYDWSGVEPTRGAYQFSAYGDRYVRSLRDHGLRGFTIFDYGNPLYDKGLSPASPAAQAAFGGYAGALVGHYRDVVGHWEVYNEANAGFWKPVPDGVAYAGLLKATYPAVKAADPRAVVVGAATAGVDLAWLETVLQHGGAAAMDALSVHPYRYPESPESGGLVADLQRTRALMAKYGMGEKELWLTEIGWPNHTSGSGSSEEESANYLVRMYSLALSLPHMGPIFWYDFQNDGYDTGYNEDNFGLIDHDYAPKQPYVAAAMMNRVLANKRFARVHEVADPAYVHEYVAADGTRTLVVWATAGPTPVTLGLNAAQVEWSDASGELRVVPVTDGKLVVPAGECPVFVTGRFGSPTVTVP